MSYSITTRQLQPQPALVMRRRVQQSEIATALSEMFPRVTQYAQQKGLTPAGAPFARYLDMGSDAMTMEAGFPVATAGETSNAPSGDDVFAETLPGGLAATTMHAGHYAQLRDAHAAMQQWIAEQGLLHAGAPWESYVTDPGAFPDPKDWKTEVVYPVRR